MTFSEEAPGSGLWENRRRLHEKEAIPMQVHLWRGVHYQHKGHADDCLRHGRGLYGGAQQEVRGRQKKKTEEQDSTDPRLLMHV